MSIQLYTKSNPVLLDRVIQDLQKAFIDNLSWLNYAFGKVAKLNQIINEREYAYPAIYLENAEYQSVLPDDKLGNFSFFEVDDPQTFVSYLPQKSGLRVKVAIIFWYSLATVYNDKKQLYTEEVKDNVLRLINTPGLLKSGSIMIERLFEKAENIYKGYSLKQVDSQYLMYPYAGMRIECEIKIHELC